MATKKTATKEEVKEETKKKEGKVVRIAKKAAPIPKTEKTEKKAKKKSPTRRKGSVQFGKSISSKEIFTSTGLSPATVKRTAARDFLDKNPTPYPLPNLIEVQLDSYRWFLDEGIKEIFEEITPITDFSGKKMEIHFLNHSFDHPKYDAETAKRKNLTYETTLKAHIRLVNKETGEMKEQTVLMGSIPLMTDKGTFIVNGIERVVINQLVRSPGVFFLRSKTGSGMFDCKMIPKRGAWLEFETDKKNVIYIKIDRRRKIPFTTLLRCFGYEKEKEIIKLFGDVNTNFQRDYILATLEKDPARTKEEAYQQVYKRLRPGDLATPDNAKALIDQMFFDFKRYDLGAIARYKINSRLGLKTKDDPKHRVFQVEDFVEIVKELIRLNNDKNAIPDDIDHLANRRIRSVGELVQNKMRVGMLRTERISKDRMTVLDLETVAPTQLVNSRPITASLREFFAGSQLSQFMDQINPLAELAHKRRLSAIGPGGLTRERAGFDVRDVHISHYGRLCPIATPEGPNIGLVVHLSIYARINKYGFIETPYRTVKHTVDNKVKDITGRIASEDIKDGRKILTKKDEVITKEAASKIAKLKDLKEVPVRGYITDEVNYYDARAEQDFTVAQASSSLDELGQFTEKRISARKEGEPIAAHVNDITHIDIAPQQIISVSTSLIPFLEHDDNTRASMGSNMQRQAVSLISPDAPYVGTGMEEMAARFSGQALVAERPGEVKEVDASKVTVLYDNGEKKTFKLNVFMRSNQATCVHMRPAVEEGQKLKRGDVIANGAAVDDGELSLGQNLLVAYMPWNGFNFEDAVVISDRVFREGRYDSIHIETFICNVRETKLGPEIVTRDIPNVGEDKLKDLDVEGIVRIGATVHEGDILVGKITPKGETELSAEERLLQAIFGDKAKDVKDTSLRLPGGEGGKVVDVQIFAPESGDKLQQGIIKQIKVYVAQTRKISVGDKMAGRHGNKGVVSIIVPEEDMPYLADGTPVDICLNPLGVTSRMNIGQIMETHLGWCAKTMSQKLATPALDGVSPDKIIELLKENNLPEDGKVQLYDGRTGDPFETKTTVGITYMMKLLHLVEDKIHARSVGPYSLVTQQPLGGKAQHGGQRFGEMEVWALEAYGAAHTLQEMLTIKSDDVHGRAKAYESIVKEEAIKKPSTPESFHVLVKELQALNLYVDLIDEKTGKHESGEEYVEVVESEEEEAEIKDDLKVNELSDKVAEAEDTPEAEVDATGESAMKEMKEAQEEDAS